MKKKLVYLVLAVAGFLLVLYYVQPNKSGKGIDHTTRYELVQNWPALPRDLKMGNPTGIGIDTNQNIVVFHRAGREWPLLVSMPDLPIASNTILTIDKEKGHVIKSWGANKFIMPHGLTVDQQNNIWVTDVGLHQVLSLAMTVSFYYNLVRQK